MKRPNLHSSFLFGSYRFILFINRETPKAIYLHRYFLLEKRKNITSQ